jgi:hypothetical protein
MGRWGRGGSRGSTEPLWHTPFSLALALALALVVDIVRVQLWLEREGRQVGGRRGSLAVTRAPRVGW